MLSIAADEDYVIPSPELSIQMEDGTANFYGIACMNRTYIFTSYICYFVALQFGFKALERVGGIERIQIYTWELSYYLYQQLVTLRHEENEVNVCEIYGWKEPLSIHTQGK